MNKKELNEEFGEQLATNLSKFLVGLVHNVHANDHPKAHRVIKIMEYLIRLHTGAFDKVPEFTDAVMLLAIGLVKFHKVSAEWRKEVIKIGVLE